MSDRSRLVSKSLGGFGLEEDAPQVVVERKKLQRALQHRDHQKTLIDARRGKWTNAGQLRKATEDWATRGGIPGGCSKLEAVPDQSLSKLLSKGETISEGVERCRCKLAELADKQQKIERAPWPLSAAVADATNLIRELAKAGKPQFESAIKYGQPISLPSTRLASTVLNVEPKVGPPVAFAEMPEALGLICWAFHDIILEKIAVGLGEVADDKHALSKEQRHPKGGGFDPYMPKL